MVHWKKNLYILWVTQILSLSGFGFGFPFLPYYIQELGVINDSQVKFWVGILASVSGLTFAISAPVWGILSDRFGRKIMIMRATLAGTLAMIAMSFAPNVYVVLIIRILQGFFTGTVTAAATLVAAGAPKGKLSFSLGLMASSTYIGNTVGPFLGGYASEWLGHRYSFLLGAFVILISFLLVFFLVKENQGEGEDGKNNTAHFSFTEFRKVFSVIIFFNLSIIFLIRFTNELSKPFIPVFIQELIGSNNGASIITGNLQGVQGILTFAASLLVGFIGDKVPRGPFTLFFIAGAAISCLLIFMIPTLLFFAVLYPLCGFFLTGTSPLTQTAISSSISANRRGMLFGIQSSVSSFAWALAPLLGSAVAVSRHVSMIYLVSFFVLIPAAVMMGAIMLLDKKSVEVNV